MNRRLNSVAVLLAAGLAHAQTVDQIIARNIAARGGVKRLSALRSQSMTGTLGFAPNPAEPFHAEMKRPGRIHQEISVNHDSFTQVSDGQYGWTLRPNKPPEPMP